MTIYFILLEGAILKMCFSGERFKKNVFLETELFRKVFLEGEILKKNVFFEGTIIFLSNLENVFLNFEDLYFKGTINIRRLLISQ